MCHPQNCTTLKKFSALAPATTTTDVGDYARVIKDLRARGMDPLAKELKRVVSSAAAPATHSTFSCKTLELPPGVSGGIELVQTDRGVKVNLPFSRTLKSGLFVHSIQIGSDLDVTHLNHAARAQSLLDSNIHQVRRLTLEKQPQIRKLVLDHKTEDGFYYSHALSSPASLSDLQITLMDHYHLHHYHHPRVESVSPDSPLAGRLYPHQVIVSVRIPGRPDLNAQTAGPGFTAARVQEELDACADISGIHLVVKDEPAHFMGTKTSKSILNYLLMK